MSEQQREGTDTGWLVVGLVLGEELPSQAIEIAGVTILPLTEEQVRQVAHIQPRNVRMHFEDDEGREAWQLQVTPHHVSVTSGWGFSIQLADARDFADAEEQALARTEVARTALCLAVGSPYVFEPRRIIGPEATVSTSGEVAAMPREVSDLPASRADEAAVYVTGLEADLVARASAKYLDRAATLELAAIGLGAAQPGILHNYFMATEGIAREVVKNVRDDLQEQSQAERGRIVDELREVLARETPEDEKAQAIRNATNELSRLDLLFMDLQLEKAGELLGLDQAIIDLAKEFNRVRNRYLSHYRSEIPAEKVRYWFEEQRALRVAAAYLRAYLDRARETPPTSQE